MIENRLKTNATSSLLKYFVLISLTMSFSSCRLFVNAVAKGKLKEANGAIPPDFGKNSEVLIVALTGDPKFEKVMLKIVPNKYRGESLLLYPKEIKADKYSDLNKYRYIFTYEKGSDYVDRGTGKHAFTTKQFYVLDRRENKKYLKKFTSSWWPSVAKAYLKNLDKKRNSWAH